MAEYTYNVPMAETLDVFKGNVSNMHPAVRAHWEQVRATYAVAERLEAVVEQVRAVPLRGSADYFDEVEARVVKAEDLVELMRPTVNAFGEILQLARTISPALEDETGFDYIKRLLREKQP